MHKGLTLLVTSVLFGGLTGCGGEADSPAGAESAAGRGAPAAGVVDSAPGSAACELVTQQDASALFGQPASPDSGPSAVTMIDQCLWTWDTETSNQLLQFFVWDPIAYDAPEDSEPMALGDGGYLRTHPMAGVDIAWLQGGRMIALSYSTIGPDAPKATDRVEQVKALARQVESRL